MAETLIQKEVETRLYECAYLIHPNASEEEITRIVNDIKKIVERHQGIISQEQSPFKRRLSYPILKQPEAYFGFLRFSIEPRHTIDISKALKLETPLLRFLIINIHPQQLQEEQRQTHRQIPDTVKKLYRPKKEAPQEIKSEEFEQKLKELLSDDRAS